MALFGIGKKKKVTDEVSTEKPPRPVSGDEQGEITPLPRSGTDSTFPILRPRVTEKATDLRSKGVFCFDVLPSAGKKDIERAVSALYNVRPVKIRVVKVPGKRIFARGKRGFKSGGKKAYVYLKEGEKIEI